MNIPTLTPDFNGQPLTMSSREIAELCEKRHDHVLRDIGKMLQDIDAPKFGAVDFQAEYTDAKGETRKEYRLPKDLTVTLITGYRADLRYKVVKRLEELESQSQPAMLSGPQLMAAALIEADATLKAQAAQIEGMREDVAAFERISASEGSVGFRVAAKTLKMTERKFRSWLYARRWCFKQGRAWQGYADKVRAGYVENFAEPYTCPRTGEDKIDVKMAFTPKGITRLAHLLQRGEEA